MKVLDPNVIKRLVNKYEGKITSHAVEHKKALLWALIAEVTEELNKLHSTQGTTP